MKKFILFGLSLFAISASLFTTKESNASSKIDNCKGFEVTDKATELFRMSDRFEEKRDCYSCVWGAAYAQYNEDRDILNLVQVEWLESTPGESYWLSKMSADLEMSFNVQDLKYDCVDRNDSLSESSIFPQCYEDPNSSLSIKLDEKNGFYCNNNHTFTLTKSEKEEIKSVENDYKNPDMVHSGGFIVEDPTFGFVENYNFLNKNSYTKSTHTYITAWTFKILNASKYSNLTVNFSFSNNSTFKRSSLFNRNVVVKSSINNYSYTFFKKLEITANHNTKDSVSNFNYFN